jgi:phycobilisome rod-core linker protein
MVLPLLDTKYSTQAHRVATIPQFGGDDKPVAFRVFDDEQGFQTFVYAAYRQIFTEHLMIESNRQVVLESQLRNQEISVQQFVRGLGKSEVFRRLVLEPNNNYRFVEIVLKRFLGRDAYNKQETIKWSIIIAQKGYHAFIDAVVSSDEYQENFGADVLPYQRRPLSQPYNLTTPRFANVQQLDQRRPMEKYQGPKIRMGWKSVVEEYTVEQAPVAGDSRLYMDLALAIASGRQTVTKVSVWDIKLLDMSRR